MKNIEQLLKIMSSLRDPDGGCPWDRKQTFQSIVPYTIEEAYEVADAIEKEDYQELRHELGDLLFQVVFYSQMAKEKGWYEFSDVVDSINEKMIRRHPHVFDSADIRSAEQQTESWEKIKAEERKQKASTEAESVLEGISCALPGMTRAKKIQKRAATVGFDWPDHQGVLEKINEEIQELKQAVESGDKVHMEEELGDLLFVCVNLARHLKLDPETCVRKANRKFEQRFQIMEELARLQRKAIDQYSLDELDQLWNEAKEKVKQDKA